MDPRCHFSAERQRRRIDVLLTKYVIVCLLMKK